MTPTETQAIRAAEIAKEVADRCHGARKLGQAPARYALIYQAAMLGAKAALSNSPAGEVGDHG